jgi:hypothetical protein
MREGGERRRKGDIPVRLWPENNQRLPGANLQDYGDERSYFLLKFIKFFFKSLIIYK